MKREATVVMWFITSLQLQPEGLVSAPTLIESEAEDIEQAGLSGNFQLPICCSLLPGCIMLIKPLLSKW